MPRTNREQNLPEVKPLLLKSNSSNSNTFDKSSEINVEKITKELELIQYSRTVERRDQEPGKKNKLLDLSDKGKKYYDSAEYFLRKEQQLKEME